MKANHDKVLEQMTNSISKDLAEKNDVSDVLETLGDAYTTIAEAKLITTLRDLSTPLPRRKVNVEKVLNQAMQKGKQFNFKIKQKLLKPLQKEAQSLLLEA